MILWPICRLWVTWKSFLPFLRAGTALPAASPLCSLALGLVFTQLRCWRRAEPPLGTGLHTLHYRHNGIFSCCRCTKTVFSSFLFCFSDLLKAPQPGFFFFCSLFFSFILQDTTAGTSADEALCEKCNLLAAISALGISHLPLRGGYICNC